MSQENIYLENQKLNEAIIYATNCHADQVRKGTNMPYIIHPLEVLQNLYLMQADTALMAAGVLHDTVEDTDATIEEITAKFGKDVASLVDSHTEKDKSKPWRQRKVEALAHCSQANTREQMLVLADKLANIRAMVRDYAIAGNKLWDRFNKGPEDQAWYYHGGVDALQSLENVPQASEAFKEFKSLVYQLFGEPKVSISETDIMEQDFIISESSDNNVAAKMQGAALTIEGQEFGNSDNGSDTYEYSIIFDRKNTESLLLKLRTDYGQARALKDIFKKELCIDGRYFTLLRYCQKNNIKYLLESF